MLELDLILKSHSCAVGLRRARALPFVRPGPPRSITLGRFAFGNQRLMETKATEDTTQYIIIIVNYYYYYINVISSIICKYLT